MTMQGVYKFYDLTLPDSLTGSDIRFTQVSDPSPTAGAREIAEVLTGSPYVEWTGVGEQNPGFTFATKDLLTLLSTFVSAYTANNANGYLFASFTGDGDVGYQSMLAGSTRDAPLTASHHIHRFQNPVLYLQSLQVQQDGDVMGRARMCPLWDGIAESPKTLLTGQALNPVRPTVNSIFTLGPVKVNGNFLTGVQSNDVSFDTGFQERRASGEIFPSFLFGETLITKLGIDTVTASYLSTLVEPITSLSVYFRQRNPDDPSGLWPAAALKHIKITATAGAKHAGSITGGEARAPLSLQIRGPITIAVNQAIT